MNVPAKLSETQPTPNTAESIEFLKKFAPEGPWVLTCISPDRKGLDTQTFYPDELQAMETWINRYTGERNIYFTVNPVMERVKSKAKREDIRGLAWLHVDIDARHNETPEEVKERALKQLRNPPAKVPPPTVIVNSGGGIQAFWRLEEEQPINGDSARYEDLKRFNQQLEATFDGDNCHNVDRIMRLTGTINVPNEKKRKKGRVPVLATLIEFNDNAYPLTDFIPAPKRQESEGRFPGAPKVEITGNVDRLGSVEELPESVPNKCKIIIVQGEDPDDPERFKSDSECVFYVICELVRQGTPDDMIFSVITDPAFRISRHILKQKNVDRYAIRQIERAKEFTIDPMLAELNEKYAVIENIGGKCRVAQEIYDDVYERHVLDFITFEDFRNIHMNKMVVIGQTQQGKDILKPAGKWWLEHSMRRQYRSMVFRPDWSDLYAAEQNVLNAWRGFKFEPSTGNLHQSFLDHLLNNVCGGIDKHFDYLIRWMAHAVQRPAEIGHVAVVLRGAQGTGKSFFATHFGALFGPHYLNVTNSSHLVGHFNAHLQNCVVLFADEAFYAGDKRHESILKTIVTEASLMIERKGFDAEQCKSCLHVIMASNNDWVVPAAADDRRFFVLDVADNRKCDHLYFAAIAKDLEAGGYSDLLGHLQTLDISNFDVRNRPETEALDRQKAETDPARKLVLNMLTDGFADISEKSANGGIWIPTQIWAQHAARDSEYRDITTTALGLELGKCCDDVGAQAKSKKHYFDPFTRRTRLVQGKLLPDLKTARANYARHLNGRLPWNDASAQNWTVNDEPDESPF